jgi:hypothetical protein
MAAYWLFVFALNLCKNITNTTNKCESFMLYPEAGPVLGGAVPNSRYVELLKVVDR